MLYDGERYSRVLYKQQTMNQDYTPGFLLENFYVMNEKPARNINNKQNRQTSKKASVEMILHNQGTYFKEYLTVIKLFLSPKYLGKEHA